MGLSIQDGVNPTLMDVDTTSNAAHTTIYNPDGTVLAIKDKTSMGIVPGTTYGMPLIGADNETPRLSRAMTDGSLITGGERVLALHDACEGAAVNTNKWIQTLTTMTITQAAASGILLNASAIGTTTTGAMQTSHRFFERPSRSGILAQARVRSTAHFTNNLFEVGFGSPATATSASIVDGAIWRKDGTGQYVPVIGINGSETLGTPIPNATYDAAIGVTQYGLFEVEVDPARCIFRIYTITGSLFNEQVIDFDPTTPSFAVTRLQAMFRTYNSNTVATPVQHFVDEIGVFWQDLTYGKQWAEIKVSQSDHVVSSPTTAFAQLATYANNAAPGTTTPSNTAAASATLMGLAAWNNAGTSFAASDTLDLIIFGLQIPSPYSLVIKRVRIDNISLGAASGAAVYSIQWFLAVNGSALSLATAGTYPPMKKALGFTTLANAAAIGSRFDTAIDVSFPAGVCVFPGRFCVIGARVIGASIATTNQVIRTAADIDGYFE